MDENSNFDFKIEVKESEDFVYFDDDEIEGYVIATINGLFYSKSISVELQGFTKVIKNKNKLRE